VQPSEVARPRYTTSEQRHQHPDEELYEPLREDLIVPTDRTAQRAAAAAAAAADDDDDDNERQCQCVVDWLFVL